MLSVIMPSVIMLSVSMFIVNMLSVKYIPANYSYAKCCYYACHYTYISSSHRCCHASDEFFRELLTSFLGNRNLFRELKVWFAVKSTFDGEVYVGNNKGEMGYIVARESGREGERERGREGERERGREVERS
jgi:hypothetical protein